MSGPGQYVPDPTEGITRLEDLPQALVVRRSRNYSHLPCPRCGKSCFRNRTRTRLLHDLGDLVVGSPHAIELVSSQHRCTCCQRFFNADTSEYAPPKSRYPHRVVSLAVRLVVEDGLPYQAASWHLWRDHRVFVPFATIQNWVEAGGKICEFHVLKELTWAILRAVAKVRKALAGRQRPARRGRPTTPEAKRAARQRQRLRQKIADLFEHRHLFVRHDVTRAERRTLQTITRGLPQLRTLRDIMEEVDRLFDRRCRTDTALAKLAKLRRRVGRFKQVGKVLDKLRSPNLDKALTFLDDKRLPSTSNAVERGNRRHRKMQKAIDRARTKKHIHNRIALDMLRDSRKEGRASTIKTLHRAREGAG